MAASSVFSSSIWIVNLDLFKAYLRSGISDKRKVNLFIREDCADKVYKGFNQFFHWEKKLQVPECRSVLTFTYMSPSGLIKPNIDVVQDMISSKLGKGLIDSINFPENSNFLTLVMINPVAAQEVRQVVALWSGAQACFVESKPFNVYEVQILWTPVFYKIEGVQETLREWCEEVKIENEIIVFSNGEQIKSNKIMGLITLKKGISLSQVPHIVKLVDSDDKYVLIVIRGRPPLCLKCHVEGHIRRSCVVKRCIKCGSLHDLAGSCPKKTFASVISSEKVPRQMVNISSINDNEKSKNIDSHERMVLNPFKTTISNNVKVQVNQHVSLDDRNFSDKNQIIVTESLILEKGNSSGQESACTLTDNDGFEIVAKRGVRRKADDGKSLGNNKKIGVIKDFPPEKGGIFAALEDEMDWGQEMEKEDTESMALCKDLSDKDSFVMKETKLEVLEVVLDETMKDGIELSKGVLTRAAAKVLGKTKQENILSQPYVATDIRSCKEDLLSNTSDRLDGNNLDISDENNSDTSDDELSFNPDLDICIRGFDVEATVDTVRDFLKDHNPEFVWNNFKNDKPDGVFGARFSSKEDVDMVLSLHKRRYHGKNISVEYFRSDILS